MLAVFGLIISTVIVGIVAIANIHIDLVKLTCLVENHHASDGTSPS